MGPGRSESDDQNQMSPLLSANLHFTGPVYKRETGFPMEPWGWGGVGDGRLSFVGQGGVHVLSGRAQAI